MKPVFETETNLAYLLLGFAIGFFILRMAGIEIKEAMEVSTLFGLAGSGMDYCKYIVFAQKVKQGKIVVKDES